jgi:hypothetical protein
MYHCFTTAEADRVFPGAGTAAHRLLCVLDRWRHVPSQERHMAVNTSVPQGTTRLDWRVSMAAG